MDKRKTILHIINNLGRGGAEIMLLTVLKELKEYNNIVVYLYEENKFEGQLDCSKSYCLKLRSVLLLPFSFFKLRKIIKENHVDMVHTHLFWSNIAGRYATPKKIPLITTIHAFINYAPDYKKWYIRFLDRFSYQWRHSVIIGVCDGVLKQYFEFLKIKPYKAYRLYTFVDTNRFHPDKNVKPQAQGVFKVFTTGTLHIRKNHSYLINAFAKLKEKNIELHIFGDGPYRKELEALIQQTGAKVFLQGDVSDLHNRINEYNLYAMSSVFEGFSLSVLEAMAVGMPLLLSDIPSFREQGASTAIYFDLNDVDDFVNKIIKLIADKPLLDKMGEAAKQRVIANFTLDHHMDSLRSIYDETLQNKNNSTFQL